MSYEKDKLFHSSKLIVPILFLLVYFGAAYAYAPLNILNSFSFTSLVVYLFMLSLGIMNDDLSFPMIDQTILVKMRHKSFFFLGKVFLLVILSFVLSLITAAVPLIINALINNSLFVRSVVPSDIISGVVLFWLVGISGGVSGLYANHRIFTSRKIAVILSIMFVLYVVIEGSVIKQLSILAYFKWLFPPVYDLAAAYCKNAYFDINSSFIFFIWLIAYITIQIVIYVFIMLKRKFE